MNISRAKKVVLGMSGGVDSSVAGFLLQQMGYQVIGVMLRTWRTGYSTDLVDAVEWESESAARQVAGKLEIPFHYIDVRDLFQQVVVSYFKESYLQGRTPNPCIVCNRTVKWKILLEQADILDAGYVATGHYAQIRNDDQGFYLVKGKDVKKDQSYFLSHLSQDQLKRTLFPIGDLTKTEVRAIAQEHHLTAADRPESQDLCFLDGIDYRTFLSTHATGLMTIGEIKNRQGEILGEHSGLANYTIGQRKGLGVYSSQPLYVLDKNVTDNSLIVGFEHELGSNRIIITEVHWISGYAPQEPIQAQVKIRYQSKLVNGVVKALGENLYEILLDEFLRDITPGQFAVIYAGEVVLGGGMILH